MASAHIIHGVVALGGPPAFQPGFVSQTVASGATSAVASAEASVNAMSIKAIDGALYVAISTGTPNAAIDPRVHLSQGETFDLAGVTRDHKVAVLNAT